MSGVDLSKLRSFSVTMDISSYADAMSYRIGEVRKRCIQQLLDLGVEKGEIETRHIINSNNIEIRYHDTGFIITSEIGKDHIVEISATPQSWRKQ